MSASKIEWTDRTWNPVTGCTKVSPGCDRCYAEGIARRFTGSNAFPNGFDVTLRPERLDAPLRWRKPARVFVNSMSDLFHDAIPDEFIAHVFAVMAATPQHTYQVLTKRHGRMRSLLADEAFVEDVAMEAVNGEVHDGWPRVPVEPGMPWWPLRNVWLGISAEDQKRADLRIPALLVTPAAVRFVSCEPLLGELDIERWVCVVCQRTGYVDDANWSPEYPELWRGERSPGNGRVPCGACNHGGWHVEDMARPGIDWVIVGGESGPGARPMHPAWAKELRDQCTEAGVPFFFKQWGEWTPYRSVLDRLHRPLHRWEDDLGPDGADTEVCRLGKKLAGRVLDGRTWDEFPAAVAT